MTSTLPVETWSAVVDCLSVNQQRNLLFVNRLLHDLALRTLFSVVKIYFMRGEPGMYMLNTTSERYLEDTSLLLVERSWELLHRITTQPNFAKVVRTLCVHAFSGLSPIFEKSGYAF